MSLVLSALHEASIFLRGGGVGAQTHTHFPPSVMRFREGKHAEVFTGFALFVVTELHK